MKRAGSWGAGAHRVAGITVLLLALLTNIFERKQEARQAFVRLVDVTEDTMDPRSGARTGRCNTTRI